MSEEHNPYKTPEKESQVLAASSPPAGEHGARGGRPPDTPRVQTPELQRLLEANMPAAARGCVVSKCRESGRRAKHYMCLHIEKVLKDAQDEATVLRAIKDYTGRSMRSVKHTWNNRDVWKGTVDRAEVGAGSRGSLMKSGHVQKNRKTMAATGMRAKGGGRKNELLEVYAGVKDWLEAERSHGRF
eukprot:2467661-Pyramimonas_sp.AAC.1